MIPATRLYAVPIILAIAALVVAIAGHTPVALTVVILTVTAGAAVVAERERGRRREKRQR